MKFFFKNTTTLCHFFPLPDIQHKCDLGTDHVWYTGNPILSSERQKTFSNICL